MFKFVQIFSVKKLFFLLAINFLLFSCARVGSPNGGTKDTLAPKFLGSNIDSARINVPRDTKELRLDFDEYVNLKEISKNLTISPPIKRIKRIIPSNLANKYILIQWQDTLQANTTYNFNFGNAIVDNNEGNVLPYFNYAFSTGEKIDNLYISGTVENGMNASASKKDEKNKYVVGLYKIGEKMDFRQKPYYVSKVDPDGYFELDYLAPGEYRIIAFEDENQNSVYDPGKENIAFQKENIDLKNNISGLKLKLYPSKKPVKFKEGKERPGGILMIFEGRPKSVEVFPLSEKLKDFKITHKPYSDSANIWFDAVSQNIGQNQSELMKFGYKADEKQDTVTVAYRYNAKNEFTLANVSGSAIPPNQPLEILANEPLKNIKPEGWTLKEDSLSKNFSAKISETNPNKILVSADFKAGKKYQLTVPKETASSFFDVNKISKRFDFEIDKESNYGSLTIKLVSKPSGNFWAELLDEKNEVLISIKAADTEIKFPMLKPGTYTVRILVDNNGDGIWDGADFNKNTLAEDVYIFPKKITVRPLWDNVETWDLTEEKQPTEPIK